MADVFISYASGDRDRARRLAQAFGAQGLSVWWDRDILPGKTFDEVIVRELESANSVVVLWSKKSISSEWVKTEAAAAADRGVLVPSLIDRVKPPLEFRRKQTADLISWRGDPRNPEFSALARAISENANRILLPPPPLTTFAKITAWLVAKRKAAIATALTALVLTILIFLFLSSQRSLEVFIHPTGRFEKQGQTWVEYPPYAPGKNNVFNEWRRDDDFIYMYNKERHKENDPTRFMYLRLPIAGGMAQWSYPNPSDWQDVYLVTPRKQ